jgi:catechol 2,3-dioxygenase-like lactoylglutathione lyase family enzyme
VEPRVSLITLGVSDLERAIRFYRDGLAKDAGVPADGASFRGFSLAHNVRSEAEVDATLAQAVAAGAALIKPGQRVFWGGYSGYFADPDGFLWEVAHNPHFWIE